MTPCNNQQFVLSTPRSPPLGPQSRASSAPALINISAYPASSSSTTPRNAATTPRKKQQEVSKTPSGWIKIKALGCAIIAGLVAFIVAGALAVIITFFASIPLITEEPQHGTKKTIQNITKIFACVFATTTSFVISTRKALEVGKEVYDLIIKG